MWLVSLGSPYLIKTNKIWTLDTKCEGGDAHHTYIRALVVVSPARVLERPAISHVHEIYTPF